MKRITSRKSKLYKGILRFEKRHRDKKLISAATRRLRRAIAFSMRKKRKIVFFCDSGWGFSNQLGLGFSSFVEKNRISKRFDIKTLGIGDIARARIKEGVFKKLKEADALICADVGFETRLYRLIEKYAEEGERKKLLMLLKNKIVVMNVDYYEAEETETGKNIYEKIKQIKGLSIKR